MKYASKLIMRVLPLIKNHIERFNTVPKNIRNEFAAYLLFMKPTRPE